MSRAAIFAYQQPLDEAPKHLFSRALIPQLLALRINGKPAVAQLAPHRFILVTTETWKDIKSRLTVRAYAVTVKRVKPAKLNPHGYHCMNFQAYPEPAPLTICHPHKAFKDQCDQVKAERAERAAQKGKP